MGNTDHVRKLMCDDRSDVMAKDDDGNTPLHIAALGGSLSTVCTLIDEFKCDPNTKGFYGRTPLHQAAANGHIDIIRKLVRDYGCDIMAKDNGGNTPLHCAALEGSLPTVYILIDEFKCDPNTKGFNGKTLLHQAAVMDNTDHVRKLMLDYRCDVTARDNDGNTPLHYAAMGGSLSTVCTLIDEFKSDSNIRGQNGRTPIHHAAEKGHIGIVRKLFHDGCDVMAKDNDGNTPPQYAALGGSLSTVCTLIDEFRCDPNTKGWRGKAPIHTAAEKGHIKIVRKLVRYYGCDIMARDNDGNTPLHYAVMGWALSTVCTLIDEFRCDPNTKGWKGKSPIHMAAEKGHIKIVRKLVRYYGCDIMARDNDGNTPLHIAVLGGSLSTARTLIYEFECDPNTKGFKGRTPLHQATANGHIDIIRMLVRNYGCDVNALDDDGHTPMYYAINNPLMITELIRHNGNPGNILPNYKKMKKSIQHAISGNIMVVGHPGAGKSTLVEALKSDTWFNSQVANVPPHTAGIIPYACYVSRYGRTIFHDFAGDPQYYSSHSAILEHAPNPGCNIFIIVVDLCGPPDVGRTSVLYWLTFISYTTKVEAKVIIVGSRADQLLTLRRDPEEELSQLCKDVSGVFQSESSSTNCGIVGHIALDCRYTKSQHIENLNLLVQNILKKTYPKDITHGAVIFHHVLTKVGKGTLACSLAQVVKYITEKKAYLPTDHQYLLSCAKELESHGYVLLLQSSTSASDSWIVTDIKTFVNSLHEQLFSEKSKAVRGPSSNLGIIPVSQLGAMFPDLPPSVLVSCFERLQYCFKMDDHNILVQNDSHCGSVPDGTTYYLFFPALLETGRSEVKWFMRDGDMCTVGWYFSCRGQYSSLPPRFVCVLLLHLAFVYSLPDDQGPDHTPHVRMRHRCEVWKYGIQWLMESGVEGYVEVVKGSRGVVVVMRSRWEFKMECGEMLRVVVGEVRNVLREFCHRLVTTEYLFDPKELQDQCSPPEVDSLQLYLLSDVKRVLAEGRNMVISVRGGRGGMMSEEIRFLHLLWGKLKYLFEE